MRVYISGRISGKSYEDAFNDFEEYEQIIAQYGHESVNPMKNGLPFDAPWADHMEQDLASLKKCDAICLLPDWVMSTGAQIEVEKALQAGMLFMNEGNLIKSLNMHSSEAVGVKERKAEMSKHLEQRIEAQNSTHNIVSIGK